MNQDVLTVTGKVVPCRTTSRLTDAELNYETKKSKRKKFDDEILRIYGDSVSIPELLGNPSGLNLPGFLDDESAELSHNLDEEPVDGTGKAIFKTPFTDLLIHADINPSVG